MKYLLTRRAFMAATIVPAGLAVAAGSVVRADGIGPRTTAGDLLELRFTKGDPVPIWMLRTTHRGYFDVDLVWAFGCHRALRRRFPDHRRWKREWGKEPERGAYMAPLSPLRPGEGIIRFRGANVLVKNRITFRFIRANGIGLGYIPPCPGMEIWVDDGDDVLYHAIPGPQHKSRPWLRVN